MEKRVVLATAISALIIILWWTIYAPPKRVSQPVPEERVTPVKQDMKSFEEKEVPRAVSGVKPAEGKDYDIECDSWKIVVNSYGAKIKHWYIKEEENPSSWPDLVLNPEGENLATYPETNFRLVSQKTVNRDTVSGDRIHRLTFHAVIDDLIDFYKIYEFTENSFLHNIRFEVKGSKSTHLPLELLWGPGLGSDLASRKEDIRLSKVKTLQKINGKSKVIKLKPGMDSPREYLWVGIENRYFAIIFLNVDRFGASASRKGKRGPYKLSLNKEIEISPEKTASFELPFYAGPKHYDNLKKLGYELDATIQFGIFSPVSKFFLSCLKLFYGLTHNYGVAIIFLTILIQIVTFPLTLKSFESSKSMKLIQPKMKELQVKYKSDPKRLNTEIMHLYKSNKVNPLGGCLPMILQLPIFWSLFTTLRSTYELRRAPFILWITDLSSPDLLFSIGSIPVRVLPLLMGLSMFMQQKISGTGADPSQKTMMYLMPVMFTVIFMNFPSGLVLYWLVNNILVTTLQYYILKRLPKNKLKAAA